MSHVTPAGLGSQVSCPRAHAHLVSGEYVRGTSLIAIGEMAGTGREVMVRNECFLLAGLGGTFFVQKSVKIL